MITDDRITSFIKSFMTDNTAEIKDIETKAREEGVPIIRKEAESFLQTMVAMNRPENILEIGSAVGYSGILMEISVTNRVKKGFDVIDGHYIFKIIDKNQY